MSDNPRVLIGQLNPATCGVNYQRQEVTGEPRQPYSLQNISMKVVRKHVTLQRLHQIDTLMIPRLLISEMKIVCLQDFSINPDKVTAEHHQERTFPATCLIDNSQVILMMTGREFTNEDDPAFITSLVCGEVACHVYAHTYHLGELIAKAQHEGVSFSEGFIWRIVQQVATIADSLPLGTQIHPRFLHMKEEELFYRSPTISICDISYLNNGKVSIYEAPEVLKQELPNEKALSWTIGCITYELVTLKPAFCDPENTGDFVGLMTSVLQGKTPPMIEQSPYSDTLLQIIDQCLERKPSKRPKLEEIIITATLKQTE